VRAREWAEGLGRPVRLWMSDKQDAFVKTIAKEFPGVPHRYCGNHFLRDLAKPMLELDSHATVKMPGRICGLRGIEREVLTLRAAHDANQYEEQRLSPMLLMEANGLGVVLDYCAAVRGIINDSQGGPLRPAALRMSEALGEVQQSLRRRIRFKKGGDAEPLLERLIDCIDKGKSLVVETQKQTSSICTAFSLSCCKRKVNRMLQPSSIGARRRHCPETRDDAA